MSWKNIKTIFNDTSLMEREPRISQDSFASSLFGKESSKDLTIVAGDEAEVKCHGLIFSAHSPVLEAMLSPTTGMLESQTGRVTLPGCSGEGLNLLILYLYGFTIEDIPDKPLSCHLAVELFKTAHLYELTPLLDDLVYIFLRYGYDTFMKWDNPDDILDLYMFVKDLEDFGDFAEFLIVTFFVRRFFKTIRTCERYKGLGREDAEDLFWKMYDLKGTTKY